MRAGRQGQAVRDVQLPSLPARAGLDVRGDGGIEDGAALARSEVVDVRPAAREVHAHGNAHRDRPLTVVAHSYPHTLHAWGNSYAVWDSFNAGTEPRTLSRVKRAGTRRTSSPSTSQ